MKWSQLKKRFEANFADAVKGRVEVWATRYRSSHDQVGECWVTLDKQKVISMATLTFYKEYYGEANRIREQGGCLDFTDPEQAGGYYQAYDEALKHTTARSVFEAGDLKLAMAESLNLSIEDALASPSPIIRAFAMLDRRFGKRRLLDFEPSKAHPMVVKFYEIRCLVEGVQPRQDPSLQAPAR